MRYPPSYADYVALYVQMGPSLPKGGPAGLFLGFLVYGTIVLSVNQCFGMPPFYSSTELV